MPDLLEEIWEYPSQPTEAAKTFREFLSRVIPESAVKTAIGIPKAWIELGKAVRGGDTEKLGEMGKGLVRAIGEPYGIFGWEALKQKWATDPVGAALTLYPISRWGLGKAGFKPIAPKMKSVVAAEGQVTQVPVALNPVERAWNWYIRPPTVDPLKSIFTKKFGLDSIQSRIIGENVRTLQKLVPDPLERWAVIYHAQAGGDLGLLKQWESTALEETKPAYAKAQSLGPNALRLSQLHGQRMRELGELAQKHGLLRDVVDHYVTQLYDEGEKQGIIDRLTSTFSHPAKFKDLSTKPWMLFHRILESYHEAEKIGLKPRVRDIVLLDAFYEQALLKAITARAAIKNVTPMVDPETKMPIFAWRGKRSGAPVQPPGPDNPVFIKPQARDWEVSNYRWHGKGYEEFPHPSFRKWIWGGEVQRDPEFFPGMRESLPGETLALEQIKLPGTSVFIHGDALIHPKYFNYFKNVFMPSAVRQYPLGRAALTGVLTLKNTLLAFSGFHQVQETIHGLFHRVAPWNLPKISYEGVQKLLIDNELLIPGYRQKRTWMEGVFEGGIVKKIPGIGPLLEKYSDYLFEDFIPRLKMKMALAAFRRNTERYGRSLSEDQIATLTARQANAAFGELPYRAMGRNPTFQDVLRLMALAPDFLEARMRFVGQALKPWGKEQAVALLVGSLGMYIPARILNSIMDDNPHFDKPFSIMIPFADGKREFTVRSIPGDIMHLLEDPRGFIRYRESSLLRTGVEALTGRNMFGQKVLLEDQAKDVLRNAIPIPFQTLPFTKKVLGPYGMDVPVWESLLRSMGISSWPYRSIAEQEASKALSDRMPKGEMKKSAMERSASRRNLINALRSGEDISEKYEQFFEKGGRTHDLTQIYKESGMTNLEAIYHRLTLDEAIHVWGYTTAEEKTRLRKILLDKIQRMAHEGKMTPEIMEELQELEL